MTHAQHFTDDDYLHFDLFSDDFDVNLEMREVKMVTVRKDHPCALAPLGARHSVRTGDRVRFEKGFFEDEWRSYYTCIACLDNWLMGAKES